MFGAFNTFGRLGAGGLPFSERALWPLGASSPGLWIDPAYTPSEFQDSAGTTPISTIGAVLDSSNPVGLVLDRKGGLQAGIERVVTPYSGTAAGSWIIGSSSVARNGTTQTCSITLTSTNAGWKKIEFDVADFSGDGFTLGLVSGVGQITGNGHKTFIAYSPGSFPTLNLIPWAGTAGQATITNISVREIHGIHLSQSTSAARPVASARKNLLVGTATLSTQSITVAAIPHTITFSGGGTVTASGTYSGALTSGQTFTPTDGTLTLTVSGSVTSAQLERGSTATTYQAVVSASDYDTTGFPVYTKFDGTDDALSSATFSAGTLTSSMDCLIAVRTDIAAQFVFVQGQDTSHRFAYAEPSAAGASSIGSGSPANYVDGVALSDQKAGTLSAALTPGVWHILEVRGLDLSTWTVVNISTVSYGGGYMFKGALGKIELFASGQDANRNQARARMAAYFGVTLA